MMNQERKTPDDLVHLRNAEEHEGLIKSCFPFKGGASGCVGSRLCSHTNTNNVPVLVCVGRSVCTVKKQSKKVTSNSDVATPVQFPSATVDYCFE